MRMRIFVILIILITFFCGCKKDDFNPVVGFEDKLVVFAVFNTWGSGQYIRIQKTFYDINTPDNQKAIKGSRIEVLENNGKVYVFKDTAVSTFNNYSTYYNKDLLPRPGSTYTMIIYNDNYPITYGTVMIPYGIGAGVTYKKDSVTFSLVSPSNSYSADYHMYIIYSQKSGAQWYTQKREVPIIVEISSDGKDTSEIFPSGVVGETSDDAKISYPFNNFYYTLRKIKDIAGSDSVKDFRCWFYIYSMDANLYNYLYKGSNVKYSVRLDQPDWSNIINGNGVFGAVTSLTYALQNIPLQ
jgi:hypothetical protein